jgi:predicted RNase H-like nuclease (RuvC/YqgF family)
MQKLNAYLFIGGLTYIAAGLNDNLKSEREQNAKLIKDVEDLKSTKKELWAAKAEVDDLRQQLYLERIKPCNLERAEKTIHSLVKQVHEMDEERVDLEHKLDILNKTNRQMCDDMYASGIYPKDAQP